MPDGQGLRCKPGYYQEVAGSCDAQDYWYRARVPLTTLSDSGSDRTHGAPIAIFAVGRPSFRRPRVHHPYVSCSGPGRLLKREGMSHLEGGSLKAESETIMRINTFKDYKTGFIHIDIK